MADPFSGLSLRTPLRRDVALAGMTTWNIGGPARWLHAADPEDLPALLARCRQDGIGVRVMGRGSNLLVSSAGLDALVITTRDRLDHLEVAGDRVRAGAGVTLPRLARTCARSGLAGFGFLAGIPGSVGGGVTMNAGLTASGVREMASVLEAVSVIDLETGDRSTLPAGDLALCYRGSAVPARRWLVLEAWFRAPGREDPAALRQELRAHLRSRQAKQPLDRRTAGSTFKQPAGGRAAGWYIEQAGLKGHGRGGAVISAKHANWIENTGTADSDDVKAVIATVQEQVQRTFGVVLSPEVTIFD